MTHTLQIHVPWTTSMLMFPQSTNFSSILWSPHLSDRSSYHRASHTKLYGLKIINNPDIYNDSAHKHFPVKLLRTSLTALVLCPVHHQALTCMQSAVKDPPTMKQETSGGTFPDGKRLTTLLRREQNSCGKWNGIRIDQVLHP